MDKIVEFIIPVLNEEKSIREVIHHIRSHKLPLKTTILVTDGGSTDNTVSICKEENVKVIPRKESGKGVGIREAVEQSSADIVVLLDGDGTYRINNLEKFLQPLLTNKADMVIGSRMLGEKEKGTISPFNLIGNKMFNNAINFAMKTKITDSQSGCRALKRKIIIDLFLESKSFDIEVEMTAEAIAKGFKVVEVPITYVKRRESKPKLNPISDGARITKTLFFIILNYKPLVFLSIFSLIIFGFASYPTALVIYEKLTYGEITHIPAVILSAVLIVTAILVLILGILSELLVSSRRRIENLIAKKT